MRTISILFLVLATACGSVNDRPGCSASSDCATGTYCAHTSDGNVCWPDAVAPAVHSVGVTCGPPCLRDGTMHVTADVTDDTEVLSAEVALVAVDLATSVVVPMQRSGSSWAADVPLARFPMPSHFERGVRVTVLARDGARNAASVDAVGVTTVTRLRFQKQLEDGLPLAAPAVMADGTVVVPGANHRSHFVAWDGSVSSSVAVGATPISAAPLVLGGSVWLGSEDGRFYELTNGGGAWQSTPQCATPTLKPFRGALAVTSSGFVIGATEYGRLYSATSSGCKGIGPSVAPFELGPVIDSNGGAYAAAGTALRRFEVDVDGNINPDLTFSATTLPWSVTQPLSVNEAVFVPAALGTTGRAYRVTAAASEPELLATTGAPSSGYAILADGSLIISEAEALSKWRPTAAEPIWKTPTTGVSPRTPLVMNTDAAQLVTATDAGVVIAFRADGSIAWSRQLGTSTAALQPANIYTPPAAQQVPGATLSTAYFAGVDGYLHAVIVDGALDASAPWPKAFHDPRNTNRAGAQP